MKIKELMENADNAMPHLYLDMDGVQADFFGRWAEIEKVEHYKHISIYMQNINAFGYRGDSRGSDK